MKMKFGTQFEQGDVLIVPFPFSNLHGIKQRPVLVISHNRYNKSSEDIIVCGITSNLKNSRYSVLIDNTLLSEGSVPIQSRIKVDKIFTLEKNIVKKKVAKVTKQILENVKEEFVKLI